MKRKIKRMFMVAMVFAFTAISTLSVSAAYPNDLDYSSLKLEIVKHVIKRTKFRDEVRNVKMEILSFLGKVIDYLYDAIITISQFNLYSVITSKFDISSFAYNIAWATLSLALVIGAIYLMSHPDKFKASEFARSFIISVTLIVSLPTFFSALASFRDVGVNAVSSIDVSSTSTVEHTIGEQVLAENIISLNSSASFNSLKMYSSTQYYTTDGQIISPYNVNINSVFSQDVWNCEYLNYTGAMQKKFDDLSSKNMMTLLGLQNEYNVIIVYDASVNGIHIPTTDVIIQDVIDTTQEPYFVNGVPHWDTVDMTYDEYRNDYLVKLVSANTTVQKYNMSALVSAQKNLDTALACIKDTIIKALNTTQNNNITLNSGDYVGSYTYSALKTVDDIDDMGVVDRAIYSLNNYDDGEYIYAYDINFIEGLVTMIVLIVCLVFAGFKLASLLYDVMFAQIIAPIVISTDLQGAGRTKKIIQDTLAYFLVFIIVILIFKLYLIVITYTMAQSWNFVIKLLLIAGGAKFTIDGPDLVTKLIGVDAGVKSGYGTMMGIQSAGRMIAGAGRTATNTARSASRMIHNVSNAPKSVGNFAGSVAGKIDGYNKSRENSGKSESSAAGAFIRGGVLGQGGQSSAGQAFRNARNSANDVNSRYNDNKNSRDYGASASTNNAMGNNGAKGENGRDGLNGFNGISGANGENGEKGNAGIDGYSGTNGRDGNNGADGKNGSDGHNGDTGIDGKNGSDGNNGAYGSSGRDGVDGTTNNQPGKAFDAKEINDKTRKE